MKTENGVAKCTDHKKQLAELEEENWNVGTELASTQQDLRKALHQIRLLTEKLEHRAADLVRSEAINFELEEKYLALYEAHTTLVSVFDPLLEEVRTLRGEVDEDEDDEADEPPRSVRALPRARAAAGN